ncbi:hypothetical protein Pla52o_10940 [Novipirellula galeiformis]|uniref:Uncharacterized protein n=1 Tax=Novipirellula galeiformis TaxID=2528004 RepID=A0A5C6CRQ2_9BACT|nr:hypothetical protein Pla52o_10940 [Novipirellula galeiformis]
MGDVFCSNHPRSFRERGSADKSSIECPSEKRLSVGQRPTGAISADCASEWGSHARPATGDESVIELPPKNFGRIARENFTDHPHRRPQRSTKRCCRSAVLTRPGTVRCFASGSKSSVKTYGLRPSRSSRSRKRHARIRDAESAKQKPWTRFERERPNDLWQVDFQREFTLNNESDCYRQPLMGDHSPFSRGILACGNQTRQTVHGPFEKCSRSSDFQTRFASTTVPLGAVVTWCVRQILPRS